MLLLDAGFPEGVGDLGLFYAVGGEVCVGPGCGGVAVEEAPVALSRGSDGWRIRGWLMGELTFQAGVP